jgi:hypothetical protein
MVYGALILLGYCKVWPGAMLEHTTIEYTCLDEKAKPPKGGDAKQQGLPLSISSQDSLLPNQQGLYKPSTVWWMKCSAPQRSFLGWLLGFLG